MTIPRSLQDREQAKFVESPDGSNETAVRTKVTNGEPIPVTITDGLLGGVTFDSIFATYPDSITEVYTYKLVANTVAVVTIAYTNTNKKYLASMVRT